MIINHSCWLLLVNFIKVNTYKVTRAGYYLPAQGSPPIARSFEWRGKGAALRHGHPRAALHGDPHRRGGCGAAGDWEDGWGWPAGPSWITSHGKWLHIAGFYDLYQFCVEFVWFSAFFGVNLLEYSLLRRQWREMLGLICQYDTRTWKPIIIC